MLNDRLLNYINQARKSGKTDDQIRQELLDAGWQSLNINEQLQPVKVSNKKRINFFLYFGIALSSLILFSVLHFIRSVGHFWSGGFVYPFPKIIADAFNSIFGYYPGYKFISLKPSDNLYFVYYGTYAIFYLFVGFFTAWIIELIHKVRTLSRNKLILTLTIIILISFYIYYGVYGEGTLRCFMIFDIFRRCSPALF